MTIHKTGSPTIYLLRDPAFLRRNGFISDIIFLTQPLIFSKAVLMQTKNTMTQL